MNCARDSALGRCMSTRYVAGPMPKKAEILRCIVSNFVFDGVTARPKYRRPFDVIAEGPSFQQWQPHGESNPGFLAENQVS